MRLKEDIDLQNEVIRLTFQFQSGAIKSKPGGVTNTELAAFQFQSGAIKSKKFSTISDNDTQFQFQSGAIKRSKKPIY